MAKTSTGIEVRFDLIIVAIIILMCAGCISTFAAIGGGHACATWDELDTSDDHIFAPVFCAFAELFFGIARWGLILSSIYLFSQGVLTDSVIAKMKHDWREYTKRKAKKYEEEDKLKDL